MIDNATNPSLKIEHLIESLLFVAEGPVSIAQIAAALNTNPKQIKRALLNLESLYEDRGLQLQNLRGRVQLTTNPKAASSIEQFLGLESQQRLTNAALETLAIIAYRQPVTRPQIDGIRGVNSDSVIKNLTFKGLIEDIGRSEGPGRPILYGTTSSFLQHFGISSLKELPPIDTEDDHPQVDIKTDENIDNTESDPQYVSMKLPENDG